MTLLSFSQSNYHEYSSSQKTSLFYDSFDSNKNNWPVGSRLDIKNGQLYLSRVETSGSSIGLHSVNIDQYSDFEIETEIKKISGVNNNGYGLVWGASDSNNSDYYQVMISGNGSYLIGKWESGKWNEYKSWTSSSYINEGNGSVNKLTIRKVSNTIYFFINKSYITSIPHKTFIGSRVGVVLSTRQEVAYQYLSISKINRNTYNYPPEIVITEPNQSRGFKVTKVKTVRVAGRATDDDGIYQVTAKGVDAALSNGGYFSIDVPLAIGENTITVTAYDTKMKSASKTIKVNREAEQVIGNYKTNEKRVALIFGNSDYTGASNLGVNPINDAKDMASVLRSLDFNVIIKTNSDLTTMNNSVREFGRQNRDADVALFYFAGHGMQVEKTNYLVPIGVNIADKNDVSFECLSVETIQKIMETSNDDRLNIIVLDACRNNPFRSWERGGETGLAGMTPPGGTLIAFATSPGSVAANGSGRNGLYTGELIKQLRKPQRIEDVFINTRVSVEQKSGGRQSPWELARLRGKYFLVR